MTEVRIAGVDPNSYSGNGGRFVNQIGEIVGVSGQFVQVKLTCDAMGNKMNDPCEHLFLPIELSMQ